MGMVQQSARQSRSALRNAVAQQAIALRWAHPQGKVFARWPATAVVAAQALRTY